ncbi:MAG: TonB-dependent receptor [Bacteroidia bacterium]|nr:TonB-dependent receptor [Bacteroidia bacterium]
MKQQTNLWSQVGKYSIFSLLLTFLSIPQIQAQNKSLSGYVRDGMTGEALIGATIFVPSLKKGAYTNDYGFYSLTLPSGTYDVQFRYLGFVVDTQTVNLTENAKIEVELLPEQTSVDEVVISSKAPSSNVNSNEMGVTSLSINEIKKIPVIFGETDVLKTIQLLPGVKPAGEGNSGFYVRGGSSDQNLILLDEAPVYNASHLLGFFSVFNGDAIKNTKLYKGNQPAEYGGRLSSTMDISMRDGNTKDYKLTGGIGLISSRLTFEGPIKEDEGSFMVSGRRTYADLFLGLSNDEALSNSALYFYDLNAKANYKLGEKDQIFLSGYFGRDVFQFQDNFGIDWGNTTATLRWNHIFNDKLFLNSSLIYSDYDYSINIDAVDGSLFSGIQDWNLKENFTYYANSQNTIDFGVDAIYHTFTPGGFVSSEENLNMELEDRYALETAAYVSHDWSPTNNFKLTYGLRLSNFTVLGPGTFYQYNAEGAVVDSSVYTSSEVVKNYSGLEPRINATYILGENHSVKASYARNRQNIHLLSNSTSSTPTDLWIPSSEIVAPEISDQWSVGYFRNFNDNKWEASVEVYYKDLQNQIDYQNGADIFLNENVESQLVFGDGWAYGAEFLLKKNVGKFTGWVSYTLSRTMRQFEEINDGNPFPARQDRIHDVSVVAIYEPNKKWSFSGSFVYYTGDAITFPSGSYSIDGNIVPYYTERNGYRMPDYHRLDLSATWYGKNPETNLNFSLYNAYGRKNAFTIDFRESETNPGTTEAVRTHLFQWVPSVTYNFSF